MVKPTYKNTNYKILFNLYIPKENGETTEIDLILITPYGLFVIESKNYSGWIFGNTNNKFWTQTLPARRWGINKEHFYNPIKQNANHILHLKNLLKIDIPYWSIIAFSDDCEFKKNNYDIRILFVEIDGINILHKFIKLNQKFVKYFLFKRLK